MNKKEESDRTTKIHFGSTISTHSDSKTTKTIKPKSKKIINRKNIFIILRIITTFLLFWGIQDLVYSYYNILRVIVSLMTIYGIYTAYKTKKIGWIWIFGFILLLFNPISDIGLGKSFWIVIDIFTGLFFIVTIFYFDKQSISSQIKNLKCNNNNYKRTKRIRFVKKLFNVLLLSALLFILSQQFSGVLEQEKTYKSRESRVRRERVRRN